MSYKACLEIVDPRKQEDYIITTRDGKKISMLQNGFFVISFSPERILKKLVSPIDFEVNLLDQLIKTSILKHDKLGFFAITPITKKVQELNISFIDRMNEMCGSTIGYFDIDVPTFELQLNLRKQHVSYEEWIIGSCNKQFVKPEVPKVASKIHILGC